MMSCTTASHLTTGVSNMIVTKKSFYNFAFIAQQNTRYAPNPFRIHCTCPLLCASWLVKCLRRNTEGSWQLILFKIRKYNMSVCVSRCTKSGNPVESRVIQSIYSEALQRLVTGHKQKADTAQKDSYRSERACQMFEEEVPWKAPLTSPALLQLQLFWFIGVGGGERRGGGRRRCGMVNVRFSVTINENNSSAPFS